MESRPVEVSVFLFIFIVLIFAFRGYKNGLIVVISRLVSIPVSYLFAWILAKPIGHAIQNNGYIDGFMSYLVAGSLVFFASYLLVSSIFSFIHRLVVKPDEKTSQLSATGGAVLGGIIGIIIAFIAVWLFTTMQTIIRAQMGNTTELSQFEQKINGIAQSTISKVVLSNEKEPQLESLPAVLISNPSENILLIQSVADKGLMQSFLSDGRAQDSLDRLSPAELIENQNFKRLVNDPEFRKLSKLMNFSADQAKFEKQIAIQITSVWAKIRQVQNNPEFIAIASDPEVEYLIKTKNIFRMLNNAKVEQLMSLISDVEPPKIEFSSTYNQNAVAPKKTEIYRWVDDKGNVHYTDKKPPENN